MRRIAGIIGTIVFIFGARTWQLRSAKNDLRERLVVLCETDSSCKAAVAEHFESCFDEHSSMGGRRDGAKIDGGKLIQCVNERGGGEFFAYDENAK